MPSTEHIVNELVQGLEPVRPLPRLRTVAAGALGLGAVACSVVIALRGLRPELVAGEIQPSIILIAVGLGVVALGGVTASLGAAVPGRERVTRGGLIALVGGLALASGAAGWGLFSMGMAAWEGLGLACLTIALLAGLVPGVALLGFLVRAFPANPPAALAMASGGAVGMGAVSVHASCPATGVLHVLVGHALAPLLGGALLTLLLYPVFLRLHEVTRRES